MQPFSYEQSARTLSRSPTTRSTILSFILFSAPQIEFHAYDSVRSPEHIVQLHFSNQQLPFHLSAIHTHQTPTLLKMECHQKYALQEVDLVTSCYIYCAPDHFRIIKQWWGEIIINIYTGSRIIVGTIINANVWCNDSAPLNNLWKSIRLCNRNWIVFKIIN